MSLDRTVACNQLWSSSTAMPAVKPSRRIRLRNTIASSVATAKFYLVSTVAKNSGRLSVFVIFLPKSRSAHMTEDQWYQAIVREGCA